MKVLAIDDDLHILKLIHYGLTRAGLRVQTCNDSARALEYVGSYRPDVILLDIMMPAPDGFALCEALRQNPEYRRIKIFMLTAKSQMGDVEKALALGADDYIVKPFDPEKLASIIWGKV